MELYVSTLDDGIIRSHRGQLGLFGVLVIYLQSAGLRAALPLDDVAHSSQRHTMWTIHATTCKWHVDVLIYRRQILDYDDTLLHDGAQGHIIMKRSRQLEAVQYQ